MRHLAPTFIKQLIPTDLHLEEREYLQLQEKIKSGLVFGSLNSRSSQQLQTILSAFPELTTDDFKKCLSQVDLFGVNLSLCNACASKIGDRSQIVVLDGMLHVLKFFADFIAVMPVLRSTRGDQTFEVDGVVEREDDIFALAVTVAALHFVETGLGICSLSEIMGPNLRFNSRVAWVGATIFLVGHELGHLQLGHLEEEELRTETSSITTAIQEPFNRYKDQELAADAYAFNSFDETYRALNVSSILIMFSIFSLLETMLSIDGQTHPLTVNRMEQLVQLAATYGHEKNVAVAKSIIASEINRYERLELFRKQYGLASISALLSQSMPASKALEIIDTIKARVLEEIGVLEGST